MGRKRKGQEKDEKTGEEEKEEENQIERKKGRKSEVGEEEVNTCIWYNGHSRAPFTQRSDPVKLA